MYGDESICINPVTGEKTNPQKSARFTGIQSFMRPPLLQATGEKLADIDIGLVGVPYDGGVTYRSGARLGPRAVREQSVLTRTENHHIKVAPFDICRVRDLGDVPFRNVLDMDTSEICSISTACSQKPGWRQ